MSDDPADLDAVVLDHHWYVEGRGTEHFATKGAAIAYAWTLTNPGGIRPSVKMREDKPVVVAARVEPPRHEVKVTVDRDDDAVDFTWAEVGETLVARPIARTVTIELTAPVLQGVAQEMMLEQVRNALHGEARARGLVLISDASLEMFTDGMRSDMKMRATARARPKD